MRKSGTESVRTAANSNSMQYTTYSYIIAGQKNKNNENELLAATLHFSNSLKNEAWMRYANPQITATSMWTESVSWLTRRWIDQKTYEW